MIDLLLHPKIWIFESLLEAAYKDQWPWFDFYVQFMASSQMTSL